MENVQTSMHFYDKLLDVNLHVCEFYKFNKINNN